MGKILTISIAAYNVEKFIRKALDSLTDKSVIDELEIFVIDDGGTDYTLKIAQEYTKLYPQSIFPVHKENGGYGSTINTAIEMASGKYFKQLDGDDWYKTENLKELIQILKTVTVDCVLTDYIKYYEPCKKEEYKDLYPYLEEGEYIVADSGIKDRFSMYTSIFSTELLKNMPNRLSEHSFYTDIEYSALPIPYVNTFYVFHKAIYVYRIGVEGQSMSVEGITKHYKEHENVFWRLLDIYNTIPDEKNINKIIFRRLLENRLIEHYKFICLLPISDSNKSEIIKFNKNARKRCPEILNLAIRDSKRVAALSYCPSFMYSIVSRRVQRE